MKKKFKKELLEEILEGYKEGYECVDDQFIRKSKWHLHHLFVFREPGQKETAWSVTYIVGATENQACDPFEYDPDEIECSLVRPTEITVISWIEVNE